MDQIESDFYLSYNISFLSFFLLSAGVFDVWTLYDANTWVVHEGVSVRGATRLDVYRSEAVHSVTLALQDKDGQPIVPREGTFVQRIVYAPNNTIWFGAVTPGAPRQQHFSEMSSSYTWEWRLDLPWKDDWYDFNGQLTGLSTDLTYQNDPATFRHMAFYWHPRPSQSEIEVERFLARKPGQSPYG